MKNITEIISDSYYLEIYQLREVDLTITMSDVPDKEDHCVEEELGLLINYFFRQR